MYRHTSTTQVTRRVIKNILSLSFPKLSCTKYLPPQIPMRLPMKLKYLNNWFPIYLKMRTTDGQTDGLMDQSFKLTWFLTTAFYETSVVTKFGPLSLLRPWKNVPYHHISICLSKPVFTPLPKRDEPKAQSEARSWVRAAVLARVAGNC